MQTEVYAKIIHISDTFKITASPEIFENIKISNMPCFIYQAQTVSNLHRKSFRKWIKCCQKPWEKGPGAQLPVQQPPSPAASPQLVALRAKAAIKRGSKKPLS
jgi:hypothetical protein